MKKKLVTLLLLATVLSTVGCNNTTQKLPEAVDIVVGQENLLEPSVEQDVTVEIEPEQNIQIEDTATEVKDEIAEGNWVSTFSDYMIMEVQDYNETVEGLCKCIDGLAEACDIPLDLVAMEVEPGYLTGFDDVRITGFERGAQFGPMIGSIPFVGYLFELEDGEDPEHFMEVLRANANLRWNICTAADEMSFFAINDIVFFAMHPSTFETEQSDVEYGELDADHVCEENVSWLEEVMIDENGAFHSGGQCSICGTFMSFVDGERVE